MRITKPSWWFGDSGGSGEGEALSDPPSADVAGRATVLAKLRLLGNGSTCPSLSVNGSDGASPSPANLPHPFSLYALLVSCPFFEATYSVKHIAIFGDAHGHLRLLFQLCRLWQLEHKTHLDGIIVCGDLGFFPDVSRLDKATRRFALKDPVEIEIGQRLGLRESGVKSILVRTRRKLRDCIERRLVS